MTGRRELEINYYNIKLILPGTISILIGIFGTYLVISENPVTSPETLIGLSFIAMGLLSIGLWNKISCSFDKNRNVFKYKTFSLIRGREKATHKLDDIEKVIYNERFGGSGRGRRLQRIAMVEMENGITYNFHKSSGRILGMIRNNTMKKARETAEFLGVELETNKYSPGQAIKKATDMIGGN